MCRKNIGENHRTFWMLVSEFFVRHIVCTVFKPTVYFVLDIVLNDVQSIQRVLDPETKYKVTIQVINKYYESALPPRWQNTCLERLTHFQLVCVSPNRLQALKIDTLSLNMRYGYWILKLNKVCWTTMAQSLTSTYLLGNYSVCSY